MIQCQFMGASTLAARLPRLTVPPAGKADDRAPTPTVTLVFDRRLIVSLNVLANCVF